MGGGGGASEFLIQLFPFIALFAIMYFLVLRPQQRRVKEHREMVANVRRGDTVVTSGGLIGKVTKVDETEITVEIAENVRVRVVKGTLSEVRSKSEPVPANTNTPS
ncbi:preprotein translocase subunit YajC [Parvibaculum sp.]|jgi:preprotein translocase subunit YajC|uniref:preprotein translocase subunit YajC n=1 Tax=Parvibaculum sp. TaxID=2024848 RepID=UPI000C662349|nr:preprotein translocase subunit YajC [Parvibaculum sp.]HAC59562.1 preprotein translocase subunit YajC [Rhodobiaceae bacterium]MAU60378.1 preprotein translocase subunit YajC [Parvibaculum sp.]MBO6669254.1 preprotein translocase subunit YajC [Parvibaculum sp.]MBO6693363.1 preprotein translocase subunit YajC [Parvibaculum sp.]MBO6712980.1 preprotein translocase subunit YajC [Parvibaculum sp.]|tara:strand:- start:4511 stop:4828 length:318 start_codon:yes stop_codon:yes gene_type:complete